MDSNSRIAAEPCREAPGLPTSASVSLNRCNLPAALLGSLSYQAHPVPLEIDCVRPLHDDLFALLADIGSREERARRFMDYMTVHFRLDRLEEVGLEPGGRKKTRINADYLRMVRGWSFDSAGREAAVLKSWVESRFGLLARHHGVSLSDRNSAARRSYLQQAAEGIYATNAIEAQLDLLYSYCQYELARKLPYARHLTLFRGMNRIDEHEILEHRGQRRYRLLLNNLSSFTASRERADEHGDYILEAEIPLPKIFFFNRLLPGMLKGEDELVVIGGVYEVVIETV